MPTLVHACGFEEGGYSDGPYSAGAHNYADAGNADWLTWDSTVQRNGRYCLKMAPVGSSKIARLSFRLSAAAHVVGSIWFRWNTAETASQFVEIYGVAAGFRVSSAGVVSASAGSTYADGPTVAADTWHHLDFYLNLSANPRVLKWQVNSSAQSDVSYAAAATTADEVRLTTTSGTAVIIYLDDWVLSVTAADYPLGPYAIEGLYPTGDGTHDTAADFQDESGGAPGSTTYTRVVPTDPAEYWEQVTASGTAYLEWTLPNTSRTNAIDAVAITFAMQKSGAIGYAECAAKVFANSLTADVFAVADPGYGGWYAQTALMLQAPGAVAWTTTIVNAAKLRWGYATDAYPPVRVEMAVMEVAYVDEPDETTPIPPPDPTPGVWIDWNLDGFGTGASDNITTDVMSVTWSRGASSDHVSAAGPGNATIIVQNSDGKYNPDNGASALIGLLLPNRPVWCGAISPTGALSGSGTVRGFFGGYTTEIVPTPVPGGNPSAEILCEDALGSYRRTTASVTPSQDRSHGDFRNAILNAIGEAAARRDLDDENGMLPFSAADTRQALGLLEELNKATASRHFISPADTKEGWYDYTVANKLHKLASAADEAIDADNVTDLSGYRVTWDNINNEQRAVVSPIAYGSVNETVWTYGQVPFTLTSAKAVTIWTEFADYVFNASVLANSSGGTLASVLTNFGRTAKIVLTVTGAAVTVSSLTIQGQHLQRGDNESVVSATALTSVSQGKYGIHAGSDIDTDLIGQTGAAQGIVDYLAWKFAEPLKRPTITYAGKDATTRATLLDRDLFDVITLTVDRLNVVARRFEIIGLKGSLVPGTFYQVSYELQETPNQAATTYFTLDIDSLDGAALLAPF